MVRSKLTARKSTAWRPLFVPSSTPTEKRNKFFSFKMRDRQDVDRFLDQYYRMWEPMRLLHVTELDGLFQLVEALSFKWRPWAASVALEFVHPDMEVRVTGNLARFISLVRNQFLTVGHPPMGTYPPPSQFINAAHRVLSDILAPGENNVEVKSDEIVDTPSPPMIDLYGQPFSLSPPSSPIFSDSPSSRAAVASVSGTANDDEGEQPVVGTSQLQPLVTPGIPFVDNISAPTPGIVEPADVEVSHEREESDPETPEGYYDVDY